MPNYTVSAPLPPKELNPNVARGKHWAMLAKIRAKWKEAAWFACRLLDLPKLKAVSCAMQITFNYHTNRRRDPDNLMASMKSFIDGMVMYGLLADDDQITYLPTKITVDKSIKEGTYVQVLIQDGLENTGC